MYFYSINSKKEDFSRIINLNLESSANTIDNYIFTSKVTSINFLQDPVIQDLIIPYNYILGEKKVEIVQIPEALRRYQNILIEFVDSIVVYSDRSDVYTVSGLNDFDSYFNSYYRYEKYDASFWIKQLISKETIKILPISNVTGIYSQSNKTIMPIVFTKKINDVRTVMIMNLSTKKLNEKIIENSIYESTKFVLLGQSDEVIVKDDSTTNAQINKILEQVEQVENNQYVPITHEGKDYIATYVESDGLGWKYISITPESQFNEEAKDIILIIYGFSIGLLIMGLILSYFLSRKIYSPIKAIKDTVNHNQLIHLGKNQTRYKNEFDLINKRIISLINHSHEYAYQLEEVSNQYTSTLFLQLIRGADVREELVENFLIKELGDDRGFYACVNILFEFKAAYYKEIPDVDRIDIIDGLRKSIHYFLQENLESYVLPVKQNLFTCIVGLKDLDETELIQKSINSFMSCFKYDLKYSNVYIGIGKLRKNIHDLSKSYNEAMTAIYYREQDKEVTIQSADSLNIDHISCFTIDDKKRLMNILDSKDLIGLKKVITEIFDKNISKNVSYQAMNLLIEELYNTGIRFTSIYNLNIEDYDIFNEGNTIIGNNQKNYGKVIDELMLFFEKIVSYIVEEKPDKFDSIITTIIRYVEEHYGDDLYLEKIAEETNTSVKYLSRIFKQKVGTNLSEYISIIRVNKAKELLRETEIRIEDISNLVGIYSRTTFLRLFKKYEGISPGQYRKLQFSKGGNDEK